MPDWQSRAALAVLLGGTALLYLWGLGESGWANSFYSAAAQAGSESWRWVEVVVLTATNLFVTVMCFVAMRVWIFSKTPRR